MIIKIHYYMKPIILFSMFFLITWNMFGQCAVETITEDDGTTYYQADKEQLYQSDDLADGVLMAFGQLTVLQHPENKKLMSFVMTIHVGADDGFMIIPRKLTIAFKDYTLLTVIAETLDKPTVGDQWEIQSCGFRLTLVDYGNLHKKAISSIKIEDTRTKKSITSNPYEYLFKEQADCIAKNIKR